jgi:hypothetical protein
MAIHDDNWTEEMPTMYTYSKRERIEAGGFAALLLLVLAMMVWPVIFKVLFIPFLVVGAAGIAWTLYYFLRIAIRGR